MGLPILYFKGSQVEDSELCCISVLEGCFNLSNSTDPDEKQHYHLCLHCILTFVSRMNALSECCEQ